MGRQPDRLDELRLHAVGQGCPDILVGYAQKNHLLEIKDGAKAPSQQKLTPAQERWHAEWRGNVFTVNSTEQALKAMGIWPLIKGYRRE